MIKVFEKIKTGLVANKKVALIASLAIVVIVGSIGAYGLNNGFNVKATTTTKKENIKKNEVVADHPKKPVKKQETTDKDTNEQDDTQNNEANSNNSSVNNSGNASNGGNNSTNGNSNNNSGENGQPAPTPSQPTPTPVKSFNAERIEQLIWQKTNAHRQANGLGVLERHSELYNIAKIRANEISQRFEHTRPNGSDIWSINPSLPFGENITLTYTTIVNNNEEAAEFLVNNWKNSPGHNYNMLLQEYKYLEIGVYITGDTLYATQLFVE